MLFNSLQYAIFIIAIVILISLFKKKNLQFVVLLLASYFFYISDSGYLFLLLVYTSLLNFYLGKKIHQTQDIKTRKSLLTIGLIGSLAILAYFKYANFIIESINDVIHSFEIGSSLPILSIVLPVGISFFTFQAMSYTIDIYRNKIKPEKSLLKFTLYISFFPQLVAGPIVRASHFLPQLRNKIILNYNNIRLGLTYVGWGIIKKVVFADNIAPFVNTIFSDPTQFSSILIILGSFAFAIQLYCDFSGYTDIAIGSARIFGFKLPINFNKPYFSINPSDFWRRWHISFSTWINDYVYLPLFFRFNKVFKNIRNSSLKFTVVFIVSIMIAEALLGLWHGAAWNFVLFGVYHGVFIIAYHLTKNVWNKVPKLFQGAVTLYLVTLSFILFRQRDFAFIGYMMKKYIFFDFNFQFSYLINFMLENRVAIFLIATFVVIHTLSFLKKDTIQWIYSLKIRYWFLFVVLVILLLLFLAPSFSTEFIYFQF
jgi:alginate O-acetyltransferase complex protein AlgI